MPVRNELKLNRYGYLSSYKHDANANGKKILKRKNKVFNVHICICHPRAFVCTVIFKGGLLSS
jgi:hypothetical protein